MISSSALFIVNPISGKGAASKGRIVSFLENRGCRVVYTERAGHATLLARDFEGDTVVAVGGDGTVNEVASGLVGTGKVLGIIPCGSGNGLARHLGISMRYRRAYELLKGGRTASLDEGLIDGRPFFSACGVGLDAMVSESFAKAGSRGLKTYVEESFKVWHNFNPGKYTIVLDGKEIERKAALISVNNSNQWGNGVKVAPGARTDDGQLDVTVVSMFHTVEAPFLLARLIDGTFWKSARVEHFRASEIEIRRESDGPAHCDGEYMEAGRNINISVIPGALKVINNL